MRKTIPQQNVTPAAQSAIDSFHSGIVAEVEAAIQKNQWVIVGMAQNPVVKKARRLLEAKNIQYHYIEHGNYFAKWKERLAIKLWSGWPTFPQVFHNGTLVGGASDLEKYLQAQ